MMMEFLVGMSNQTSADKAGVLDAVLARASAHHRTAAAALFTASLTEITAG